MKKDIIVQNFANNDEDLNTIKPAPGGEDQRFENEATENKAKAKGPAVL